MWCKLWVSRAGLGHNCAHSVMCYQATAVCAPVHISVTRTKSDPNRRRRRASRRRRLPAAWTPPASSSPMWPPSPCTSGAGGERRVGGRAGSGENTTYPSRSYLPSYMLVPPCLNWSSAQQPLLSCAAPHLLPLLPQRRGRPVPGHPAVQCAHHWLRRAVGRLPDGEPAGLMVKGS